MNNTIIILRHAETKKDEKLPLKKYENKKILIVAHGTVMTLYFSYLQGELDKAFGRWKNLGFCDFGIIKNNKVIKDIMLS